MPGCKKCKDLKTVFLIKLPSELKQAIIIAKQNVADGTISVVKGETDQWPKPFDRLSVSGGWEDFVHYVFVCNSSGQRFQLSAETYHGAGGEWKPAWKNGLQSTAQTDPLNRRFVPPSLFTQL
jgi:hypothetical protein